MGLLFRRVSGRRQSRQLLRQVHRNGTHLVFAREKMSRVAWSKVSLVCLLASMLSFRYQLLSLTDARYCQLTKFEWLRIQNH